MSQVKNKHFINVRFSFLTHINIERKGIKSRPVPFLEMIRKYYLSNMEIEQLNWMQGRHKTQGRLRKVFSCVIIMRVRLKK